MVTLGRLAIVSTLWAMTSLAAAQLSGGSAGSGSSAGQPAYGPSAVMEADRSAGDWRRVPDGGPGARPPTTATVGETVPMLVFVFAGAVMLFLLKMVWDQWRSDRGSAHLRDELDLTAVMIAVGFAGRVRVQQELRRLSAAADTDTRSGVRELMKDVVALLREERANWVFVGGRDRYSTDRVEAEIRFDELVKEIEDRYDWKAVANVGGVKLDEAGDDAPARRGVVVVTLVASASGFHFEDVQGTLDARVVDAALSRLDSLETLERFRVIWSPAKPAEVFEPVTARARYPELQPVSS